ncbi:hypothetical protein ABIA35_009548 [Catenulispora sp. MAP12-49]|uniref:lysylphosphatidylglycerol synthase transmembrane domain-containing protein n=1 Tax=Catenulispora sp. MAP12-49 TaxID=3156302 RepID=UPI0035188D8F
MVSHSSGSSYGRRAARTEKDALAQSDAPAAGDAAAEPESAAVSPVQPAQQPGLAAGSGSGSSTGFSSSTGTGTNAVPGPDLAPDPDPDADPDEPSRVAPNRRGQIARLAFLALTIAAGAYAVGRQWTRVQEGFAELGPVPLLVALVPALASIAAMMLAWRGLLGSLGSPLRLRPAARIFFTSQLGKYLPGSVWPVVAQMQLGRAYRIPRARSAAAAALAMLVSLSSALLMAAATLPLGGGTDAAGYRWAFAVVPLLLAGLHPKVANPALRTLFRLTRRPAIEPLTARTIAETAARSAVGWLLAGLHIWVLAIALGATPGRTLLLAIGGYAFAWSVGFIIVFAPAGAGVRELILVAALQPVLDPGKATVVALASRLVTIVADLVAAAVTAREGRAGKGDAAADGETVTEAAGVSA